MCNPSEIKPPLQWQVVCLRASGKLAPGDNNCTRWCSPNGKQCKNKEEVQQVIHEEEKARLDKEVYQGAAFSPKHPIRPAQWVKCIKCNKIFQNESILKTHQQEVHNETEMDCDKCRNDQFSTPQERLQHMNFHSQYNGGSTMTVTCKRCSITFNNAVELNKHLQAKHGPPGPPTTNLDARLQKFNNNVVKNSVNTGENMLNSISGLTYTKRPAAAQPLAGKIINIPVANLIPVSKPFSLQLPPQIHQNTSHHQQQQTFSFQLNHPQPPQQTSKPPQQQQTLQHPQHHQISSNQHVQPPKKNEPTSMVKLMELIALRENKTKQQKVQKQPGQQQQHMVQTTQKPLVQPLQQQEPLIPPVVQVKKEPSVKQERVLQPKLDNSLHKVKSGKIMKRKSEIVLNRSLNNSYNRFKISVSQVCRFLKMNDYPVPLTEQNRNFFKEYQNFENFYLPLIASVNPTCDPLKLKTLSMAKWREIVFSNNQSSTSLYFSKPKKNLIKVNILE